MHFMAVDLGEKVSKHPGFVLYVQAGMDYQV